MENSIFERAIVALERIAESLEHINEALHDPNGVGITDSLEYDLHEIKDAIKGK